MGLQADNGDIALHGFTLFPIGEYVGDTTIGLNAQNSDFSHQAP